MLEVIPLLALSILLGTLLILAPIGFEYRLRAANLQLCQQEPPQSLPAIAGGYRYVCWLTGTGMITAAIVLLFRLGW
jgi:hypothetical protein